MARTRKIEASYPAGPATQNELEQLRFAEVADSAYRALVAKNQLGVISANSELEYMLRQNPAVASELDAAKEAAMADEVAGKNSYRFPG